MKSVLSATAAGAALMAAAAPQAALAETPEEAKTTIWALEQSIYQGRAKGDLTNYASNLATGYLSWPPGMVSPIRGDKIGVVPPEKRQSQEVLQMTFKDISVVGNVAIIYYRTHMTRQADGTPVNKHYEVTHTWVKEGDKWHVFGGMAREATTPQAD